jgi:hypothetical protein
MRYSGCEFFPGENVLRNPPDGRYRKLQEKRRIIVATPTPIPAPAPKSGGALKVVLIVLGVFAAVVVLLFGLLAYGCYHIAHSFAHSVNGKSTITIPGGGSVSTNDSATPAELGTDIYPGAKAVHGGSKISMPNGSIITGVFGTQDSVQQVEAFYKDKFGSTAVDYGSGEGAMVSKKVADKESINVTITANKSANADYKTKFIIMHTAAKGN